MVAFTHTQFSSLSDQDLEKLVKVFCEQQPESGLPYFMGFLHRNGLKVQRQHVQLAVKQVDYLGQTLCQQRTKVTHQQYHVSWPNALWHINGHHKLIYWGIVMYTWLCRWILSGCKCPK